MSNVLIFFWRHSLAKQVLEDSILNVIWHQPDADGREAISTGRRLPWMQNQSFRRKNVGQIVGGLKPVLNGLKPRLYAGIGICVQHRAEDFFCSATSNNNCAQHFNEWAISLAISDIKIGYLKVIMDMPIISSLN